MEPLTLLAAIVATALKSLAVDISTVTDFGVTLNQSPDAAFQVAYQTVGEVTQQDGGVIMPLQRSVHRAYLIALQSIVQDCQQTLFGLPPQQYRGSIGALPSDQASDLRWLNGKLAQLVAELQALKRSNWTLNLTFPNSAGLASARTECLTEQSIRQQLIDEALQETTIPAYREQVTAGETGLFARLCTTFAIQLGLDIQLQTLWTQQFLPVLNAKLLGQSLVLDEIVTALQSITPPIPSLAQHLEAEFEAVLQDSTVIRQSLDRLLVQQTVRLVGSPDPKPAPLGQQPLLSNPFLPLAGRIEKSHQFFDRKAELGYLFELLNQGQNIVMTGDRSIGKSSLLWMLQQQAPQKLKDSRQVITLDWPNQPKDDEPDFFQWLCKQLRLTALRDEALDRALQSHRLLLLLDGIETMMGRWLSRSMQAQLCRLANGKNAPLRLLFATHSPLEQLLPDRSPTERIPPLAAMCQEVPLFGWDEATCHAFIHQRLQPTPIRFTPQEVMYLIDRSHSNPRRLMNLCHQCYSHHLTLV